MITQWECWIKKILWILQITGKYNLWNSFYPWDFASCLSSHSLKRLLKEKVISEEVTSFTGRRNETSMWFNNLLFRNHYCETQMLKKFYYRSLLSQYAEIILWFGDGKCYGLSSVLYWIFQIHWRLLPWHVYK